MHCQVGWFLIGVVLSLSGAAAPRHATFEARDQPLPYLTSDSELKHDVTVIDEQGGFAPRVQKWTVAPSGEWSYEAYLRANQEKAVKKNGRLNEEALDRIIEVLGAHRFGALPAQIGPTPSKVNAHTLTVQGGDITHTATLYLRDRITGEKPLRFPGDAADDQRADFDDLIHVARCILQATTEHESKPEK